MGAVLDNRGPINATTAYVDGRLVARNTNITLPEVTYTMATVETALGEHEVPILGRVDALESTINKIGADEGLVACLTPEAKTYEFRWVQQVTKTDGSTEVEGCKAFIRATPKVAVPSMEIAVGESVEMEIPLSVTRYQLMIGGKEAILIDKLAGIIQINGKNYAENFDSML